MTLSQTSSKENGLHKTTDFSIFKFREDNREYDKNHLNKLIFEIEKSNDLNLHPIIVNSEMEIIDGQHRYLAAKKLNLPVYYIVDENYTPGKMIIFNSTQRGWKLSDYLNYWCHHGKEDYIKFREFSKDMGLSYHALIHWVDARSGSLYKRFKSGTFTFSIGIPILEALVQVKRFILLLKSMNIKPQTIYVQIAFHKALKEFFTNPLIDFDRFFDRFCKWPHSFVYFTSTEEYLEQLVNIYNYGMKSRRVRFVKDGKNSEIIE